MVSIPPILTLVTTLLQHEMKNTFVLVGEGDAIWMLDHMADVLSNRSQEHP